VSLHAGVRREDVEGPKLVACQLQYRGDLGFSVM
jgi:hypothetical protein